VGANFLIVGQNSFLAGRFRALTTTNGTCRFVSHQYLDASTPDDFRSFDCIVNFACDPDYRSGQYSEIRDFDVRLAEAVRGAGAHYIMLSSRAVYSPDVALRASESSVATGNHTAYGRNKLKTECTLQTVLGDRLTILRMANIIGYELDGGRRTFMALALNRLKSKGQIRLDISPEVRRDFLPDCTFVRALDRVLQEPCGGLLNVGSGQAIRVGDIASWLIEGYGAGNLVVSDHRVHDEFVLNVQRLSSRYGIHSTRENVEDYCRKIGSRLRLS